MLGLKHDAGVCLPVVMGEGAGGCHNIAIVMTGTRPADFCGHTHSWIPVCNNDKTSMPEVKSFHVVAGKLAVTSNTEIKKLRNLQGC